MSDTELIEFHRRPSALAFMARAFHRSPGLATPIRFPPLRARWLGHRVDAGHLASFRRLTGLVDEPGLPLLYPHVLGFRLHMVLLTHPRFPVPIWRVLQVRNQLWRRRPIGAGERLDLETAISGWRAVAKGVEVDLVTHAAAGGDPAWQSLVTFYVRGRHGPDGEAPAPAAPPALDDDAAGDVVRFHLPGGLGWRFAGLTGDYNGLHWSDAYARRFGFPRALHHPPLVLGRCLARLRERDPALAAVEGEGAQRLDAWIKGPVHYDVDARLRVQDGPAGTRFALHAGAEPRPALIGRLRAGAAAAPIEDSPPAAPGGSMEEVPRWIGSR